MNTKDQIRESISIHEVASLYVDLKPAGKYFKALCPFHTEKTPSFFIMPDKNTYTCYGCKRFGDIFSLIQEMEHLSFPEAMNFLIEKFNLPVQNKGKKGPKPDEFLEINEIALHFYRDCLANHPEGKTAGKYLQSRAISRETSDRFQIGYALREWSGLLDHLRKKKANVDKAVELGLLVRSETGSIYDRFRGRIIFPILSESSKVIAFGGRTMTDDSAKYLNSPDTPVYKKGNHLYGFHLAKEAIRERKAAVLVEGYLDMISLYQAGMTHAVASLGTSLTDKQVYLLRRFADVIYIFYDSDAAGQLATQRALEKLFEQNVVPRIVLTPEAKDPDEFIRRHGPEAAKALPEKAENGFRYLLECACAEFDVEVPEKKRLAVDKVLTAVEKFSDDLIREEYLRATADFFRVDPVLLKMRLGKAVDSSTGDDSRLELSTDEWEFLRLILAFPELIDQVRDFFTAELLSVLRSRNILRLLFECYGRHGEIRDQEIAHQLGESERAVYHQLFLERDETRKNAGAAAERISACIVNFQNKKLNKKKLRDINQEIRVAEKDGDSQRVHRLLAAKNQFIQAVNRNGNEKRTEKDS